LAYEKRLFSVLELFVSILGPVQTVKNGVVFVDRQTEVK